MVCLCLYGVLAAPAQGRYQRKQRPPVRPPGAARIQRPPGKIYTAPPKRAIVVQDQEAIALLKKKLRPSVEFAGEQVTEVATARGQQTYPQKIEGDTNGRIRVEFDGSSNLAGDIMIIGPAMFANYHRQSGVMDIAFWPTQWNAHEKLMMAQIRNRTYAVAKVGEEIIAGRRAAIVLLSPADRSVGPQFKYWIDPQTGIQLKLEKTDARGQLISRTMLTSITLGPAANVSPQDFQPMRIAANRTNPLFPDDSQFPTVQEAQRRLPFTPLEPGRLPPGFTLKGVWVFQAYVLLRYSDNVANFSLYEHLDRSGKPEQAPGPAAYRRHIQRWHMPMASGAIDVIYIGSLTPEQARELHDSLH
jgi:hypothetical protein